jgi:hypothetical protein
MRRRVRGLALAAALAAALVALAGCVTIPTGGGVTTVRISEDQGGGDTIRVPQGPVKGMTPAEIVAGFVRAGGAPQNSYDIAKQFLAASVRSKWNPNQGITLSDSPIEPAADGAPDEYTVALGVVGQIDPSGVYTAQRQGQRELAFHVVKEHGEWRIDRAPDGTVLSTRDLGGAVKPYDLYFFAPGYDFLVPDLRWFGDQGAGYLDRRIVTALLAGPAKWLASPVLVSAFPSGTELGDPPTLDAGTVTVDLSSQVLDASETQRERMLQQLTLSLLGGDARAVTMTANGLQVPVAEAAKADPAPSVIYDAIGSDGKAFGSITSDGIAPLPTLGAAEQELAPTAAALSRDRSAVAVLGAGGVSLVTTNGHAVVDARPGLVAPSIDPLGYVWSAQASPASLDAVRADGRPHAMPLPLDGSVVAISVSRDGTRLLVALATDSGPRVTVLGIQRDKDGVPTGFGPPLEVPLSSASAIIAAAWVGPGSVALLTGPAGGRDEVVEYELSGRVFDHGAVQDGVALAAGAGGSGFQAVRVLLRGGSLQQPSVVEDWQSTGATASFLGVQQ